MLWAPNWRGRRNTWRTWRKRRHDRLRKGPAHRLSSRRRRARSRWRRGSSVPGLVPGPRGNGLRRDALQSHTRCRPGAGEELRGGTVGWPGRGRGEAGLGPVGDQPELSPLHGSCPPGGGLTAGTPQKIDVAAPDRGRSPGFMSGRLWAVSGGTARLWPFWEERTGSE